MKPCDTVKPCDDAAYMARALQLAWRGRFTTHPNPHVGCVLVRDGEVVGEGFHYRAGEAHAEIHALHKAGDKARDATAYVTLEPCSHHGRTPPCCDALIAAGVRRVVVALADPNPLVAGNGVQRLQRAGIAVTVGLMSSEVERQNRGFLKRMRHGLPWLQLKLAASLDGRTALANGTSQWITSPAARRDVQRLRALSGAILSTSATVLADDSSLTVRWHELDTESQAQYPEQHLRQPVRVLLDRQCQIHPSHRVIQQPGEIWLVRGAEPVLRDSVLQDKPSMNADQQWPDYVRQFAVPQAMVKPANPMSTDNHRMPPPPVKAQLDLSALMHQLAERQINSVWVEAGARLAGALLQADLVDELLVYLAAKLLGDSARGLCVLPELSQLADAPQFVFSDIRRVGPDVCLHLRRCASAV